MDVAVGIAVAGLALLGIDRLVARGVFDRRGPRRSRTSGTGGGGALGELIEVFQPSTVQATQERDRQREERHVVGDAAPPFGVDLDAGTADLRPHGR